MSEGGILDRRHRALTVGAVLAVSIVAFEALALTTVAPTIARSLGGLGLYAWIFSAFLLAQIVGAVAAGGQADRRGPAKPFLVSLALLGAGLLAGALSPNMLILILARALQGLGGGALVTCVYAIINTSYPDALRPRMLAAFSSAFVLPALVGPTVAGFVAEQFTWRAVFYGLLPLLLAVGLLTAPAFGRLVPSSAKGTDYTPTRNRLPSAILLAAGTGVLLTGLKVAAEEGRSFAGLEPATVGLPLAGAGLLVTIPALRNVLPAGTLVAREGLPATIAAKGLLASGYFYTEVYLILALTESSGYTAITAGLVVSAGALSWTTATWIQERLDKRNEGHGRRARTLFGVLLVSAGVSVLAAAVFAGALSLALALAGWVISGLGMGLANPASLTIAFAHAPDGREGAVSSAVLISELFFPATSIGVGGALVALGAAAGEPQSGVITAFVLSPILVALALILARRLPREASRTAEC
ncbi:MAG: MFS transporter [Actinomycetota bacterium]|nr:MFS transporter [Actinomycetota bacterium]